MIPPNPTRAGIPGRLGCFGHAPLQRHQPPKRWGCWASPHPFQPVRGLRREAGMQQPAPLLGGGWLLPGDPLRLWRPGDPLRFLGISLPSSGWISPLLPPSFGELDLGGGKCGGELCKGGVGQRSSEHVQRAFRRRRPLFALSPMRAFI